MPYKWMPVIAAAMAATPTYLLWQGDNLGAAIIGIPSLLICVAFLACMIVLAPK